MSWVQADQSARRPGRPVRVSGWTLLLVTVVVGVVCIVGLVRGIGSAVRSTIDSDIYNAPVNGQVVHLDKGSNLVYSADAGTVSDPPTGNNVARVSTAQGEQLPVYTVSGPTSIDRNGHSYKPIVRFDVPADGSYEVTILGVDQGDRVFVAADITDSLTRSIGWLVGAAVCGFFFLAAVVLLIVGYARFKKPTAASGYQQPYGQGQYGQQAQPNQWGQQSTGSGYAAGWYPDPQDSRYVRYYDGQQWTGHVQPRQ